MHCRVNVAIKFLSIATTAKRRIIFILAAREGINFREVEMSACHCLLFRFESANSGGGRMRRRPDDFV